VRNRALPPGMRVRNGYYSWTHPDGREFGLGRDREEAIAQVSEALVALAGLQTQVRLVDRINGATDRTFGAWMTVYERQLAGRKLAANTRRTYASMARRARVMFRDDSMIERITTLDVAKALGALKDAGKARSAQAFRAFLADVFRAAVAEGWIATNPVLVTAKVAVEVQRARLTLEIYRAVHAVAHDWLRNAMDLALVSGQAREEVAAARFPDFYDEHWHCIRKKTGKRLRIPTVIRLNVLGLSLADVVKRCRNSGVLSPYLVHQTQPYGNSPPGRRIWVDTVSRRFTDALASLQLSFGDRSPPTFHEIRSLSERLYAEQGGVSTQELLGHSSPDMTRVYHDARGAEWQTVKLG
jgi:integrase